MSKVADDDIRVEAEQRDLDARFLMAAFISSIDTGLGRRSRNSPFNSFTERVAATMANCPFSTSTNSMRSPATTQVRCEPEREW